MPFTIQSDDVAAVPARQSVWYDTDISILVAAIGGTGVLTGCDVTAQGSPDMTLAVASGTIQPSAGVAAVTVTAGNVTITTAHATLPRIDLVTASAAGVKTVTAGTAAAEPKPPDLPSGHIGLAMVDVPAADTAIQTAQITSKRTLVAAGAAAGMPMGLTGAVSPTRYAGGTASAAPASGTFAVGDFVVTQAGGIWVCTGAGTPGTWSAVSGVGGLSDQGVITYLDGTVAAAPGTPASGNLRLYAKTGKVLAVKDDTGAETILGPGGGGGAVATDTIWDAAGDLAVGTGADTAAKLSMGSALQALRVNAAGTALEYAAPGAGALVLLEQHTASNSASLDFTTCISSTYDEYLIEIMQMLPASAAVLQLLVSGNGGSTWDTTAAHYTYSHHVWSSAGAAQGGGASPNIVVYPYAGRTASTTVPFSGTFRLFNPLGTSYKQLVTGTLTGTDNVGTDPSQTLQVSGVYNQLAAVNALRFIMSSGNIASGTIRVYGIAK